jgi:hypothetical protein
MKKTWLIAGLKVLAWMTAALVVFGFVVMLLWNWLTPHLFGWKVIGFWQAVGLVALSHVLFGRFRFRSVDPRQVRERMTTRWKRMTPKEQDQFLDRLRKRWSGPEPPSPDPGA